MDEKLIEMLSIFKKNNSKLEEYSSKFRKSFVT